MHFDLNNRNKKSLFTNFIEKTLHPALYLLFKFSGLALNDQQKDAHNKLSAHNLQARFLSLGLWLGAQRYLLMPKGQ